VVLQKAEETSTTEQNRTEQWRNIPSIYLWCWLEKGRWPITQVYNNNNNNRSNTRL